VVGGRDAVAEGVSQGSHEGEVGGRVLDVEMKLKGFVVVEEVMKKLL